MFINKDRDFIQIDSFNLIKKWTGLWKHRATKKRTFMDKIGLSMKQIIQTTLILFSASLMTACGGSSSSDSDGDNGGSNGGSNGGGTGTGNGSTQYDGLETAANVTSDNAGSIAESSVAASQSFIESANSAEPPTLPLGVETNSFTAKIESAVTAIINDVANPSLNIPVAATEVTQGSCGGTSTATTPDEANGDSIEITMVFDDYCEGDVTLSGNASVAMSGLSEDAETTTIVMTYNNVVVNDGEQEATMNGTITLVENSDGSSRTSMNMTVVVDGESVVLAFESNCVSDFECTDVEYFEINGEQFKAEDVDVTENSDGSYDIEAVVYDPEYGYFVIESEHLNSTGCDNGAFSSGSITVADESESSLIEIEFTSCTEMVVTFDNVANTVAQ